MTPKQKAKHLVRQYWDLGGMDIVKSKQCALIAVDEILDKDDYNNDYWKEVKQEINLL